MYPICAYIIAKDHNRPHLLDAAFTSDASVRMIVHGGTISFPPLLEGREAIAETLVRRFNQTYENIYTFCIGERPPQRNESYACRWLVGMTDKAGGHPRIGCGSYAWRFDDGGPACALTIEIDTMNALAREAAGPLLTWMSQLPYPWCELSAIVGTAPAVDGIRDVVQRLQDRPPLAPQPATPAATVRALRAEGRHEDARAMAMSLLTMHPGDAELHYEAACVDDFLGFENEAVPHYVAALAGPLPSHQRFSAHLGLGSTYRALGRYSDAERTLAAGLAEFPDSNALKAFLAMVHHNLGRPTEAVQALLELLARTSDDEGIRSYRKALAFYAQDVNRAW